MVLTGIAGNGQQSILRVSVQARAQGRGGGGRRSQQTLVDFSVFTPYFSLRFLLRFEETVVQF